MLAFASQSLLDEVSCRILAELQENARLNFSELGRRVGLTAPAVAERVRRMEEAGIITGYRLEVNPAKIGLPVQAIVRLTASSTRCLEFGAFAQRQPEVLECHRITGTDSHVVKVAVSSVQHLEELIDRFMPFGETTTSIVLSSPVTHRAMTPGMGPRV